MMPTITVDDEVFAYLQSKATPFVDTPNAVLRRELPIGAPTSATPSDDIYADFPRDYPRSASNAEGLADVSTCGDEVEVMGLEPTTSTLRT